MSVFEERLWQELSRDHREALAHEVTELPRRRRRVPALASAAAAAAAALTAAVLWLSGGHSTPAYAVTEHPDGTVTVTIRQLVGVGGADARLAAIGVPVRIAAYEGSCSVDQGSYRFEPRQAVFLRRIQRRLVGPESRPGGAAVKLDPAQIPSGDTLLLTARRAPSGTVGLHARLYRGPAPPCLPLPSP